MTTIQPKTFAFLKALKKNNNRDWFNDHKSEYENAKDNVLGFIQELVVAFSTFDSSLRGLEAKDCLFRIYRDTRFSKDKTPYKTNLGRPSTRVERNRWDQVIMCTWSPAEVLSQAAFGCRLPMKSKDPAGNRL